MLPGRTPTAEEKQWMDRIVQVGCIVCRRFYGQYTPAEVHHLDGKTKPDAHLKSIGLCPNHHRINGRGWVTRHPNKAVFEAKFGPEDELLAITQALIPRLVEGGYVV